MIYQVDSPDNDQTVCVSPLSCMVLVSSTVSSFLYKLSLLVMWHSEDTCQNEPENLAQNKTSYIFIILTWYNMWWFKFTYNKQNKIILFWSKHQCSMKSESITSKAQVWVQVHENKDTRWFFSMNVDLSHPALCITRDLTVDLCWSKTKLISSPQDIIILEPGCSEPIMGTTIAEKGARKVLSCRQTKSYQHAPYISVSYKGSLIWSLI